MKCRKKAFIAFIMAACIVSTHTALASASSLEEILSALEERPELTQKESAEKESNKEPTPTTDKKNAFEFCDMYMQRLLEMKYESGFDATYDLPHYIGYEGLTFMNTFAGEGQYFVDVPAGTLLISVPDFSVIRLDTTLVIYNDDDSQNDINIIRSLVAFAALEYDRFDEYSYPILNEFDAIESPSVLIDASDRFYAAIDDVFNNEALMNELFSENGNKIPFLSGNYEYSLQYFNGGEANPDLEFIELVAECK